MSGDLKDPKSAIPKGAITAIVVGLLAYIGLTVYFAFTVNHDMLAHDPQVLFKISRIPELVIAGIWGATLSSALGSILAAPRILQATAIDKITPGFFAKGAGESNEPRNALLLTFVIAEAGILIGELNVIARIVSIFFITTYGFLNLSSAFETWTSADFRPSFRIPGWVSFLGAAACFIVMLELDFIATIGASIILGILYLYLKRKELTLQTGDTWGGVWASVAKTSLNRLARNKQHNRNWRPNILMFSGAAQARPYMESLGNAISGKLGLLSSFELIPSKEPLAEKLNRIQDQSNTSAFHHTYTCNDIYSAIDEITRVYGFSGVEPNTVLMGWSKKAENKEKFLSLINDIQQFKLNSLLLHHNIAEKKLINPTIDIWWSGWGRNLSLALNVLRYLNSSYPWNRAEVRLIIIMNVPEESEHINRFIKNILVQYRARADIKIIDNHIAQQKKHEIIANESANTDLTIIGIPDNHYDDLETTYQYASNICNNLGSSLFINASDTFEEYNVISHHVNEPSGGLKNEWILPELEESLYPEINADMGKIDEHGKQLMEALHKKVFIPCFRFESTIYKKVHSLAATTSNVVSKSLLQNQLYQRREALVRAKKYFMGQVLQLLEDSISRGIREQEAELKEGLEWYLEQLHNDWSRFPKYKSVSYRREEFNARKEDSGALRWYKFRKKILHPFSRKSILLRINYREGASYFFRDTRLQFMAVLVADLEKNLESIHEKFRQFVSWTDESFQSALGEQDTPREQDVVNEFITKFKEKAEALITGINDLQSLYMGRLRVEYRKNLIYFIRQLERVDFNKSIRKKRRAKNFYTGKKKDLTNFQSSWAGTTTLDLRTIKTYILLYDYFSIVQDEMQKYSDRLRQFFAKEQQAATKLIEILTSIASIPSDPNRLVLPEKNYDYSHILESLNEISEQLISIARNHPEEIIVSYKKSEEFSLPIRALISHLTEISLTGPITDKLEQALEKIRMSNRLINDQASLAMLNIFNLKGTEEESIWKEEIDSAIRNIKQEMTVLSDTIDSVFKDIAHQTNELKNDLKLHNLADMAADFSRLLRSRTTRRLQSKLSSKISHITGTINRAFVSALYSQSKGILLARQLSSSTQARSVNERIINGIATLSPQQSTLQKLPHYYISLFSGRSSIGVNFWVDRPVEENELEAAHQRYLVGRKGMILILGERNTGKTALCKHFAEGNSENYSSYHIFPPDNGSTSAEVFQAALRKATKLKGDSAMVFGLLPQNSLVVIHDLELWWERSLPHGLDMIRYIKTLVEEYSSKCLFLVNLNSFAFPVINTAEPIDTHCAGIVRCLPFNSLELKRLVMSRHKSSGLRLDFGSGSSDNFSEIKLARIFNKIFDFSNGNPGVAMNAWLSGIKDFSNKTIVWKLPIRSDDDIFKEMPELWGQLCLQMLLHKRMDLEKIARCMPGNKEQLLKTVNVLKRIQLVDWRGDSVYFLNPGIEFLLIKYFRKKEWV